MGAEVDDAEPAVAKRDLRLLKKTAAVGPAGLHALVNACQRTKIDSSAIKSDFTAESTHLDILKTRFG
jgi:hypothetical protein